MGASSNASQLQLRKLTLLPAASGAWRKYQRKKIECYCQQRQYSNLASSGRICLLIKHTDDDKLRQIPG